jgi:hypothetical protein
MYEMTGDAPWWLLTAALGVACFRSRSRTAAT